MPLAFSRLTSSPVEVVIDVRLIGKYRHYRLLLLVVSG